MLQIQKPYFVITLILLLTEILIALFVHDSIIRPFGGDFLIVILIYCLVRSFTRFGTEKIAFGVLIFSFSIEILQYFQIVRILGLGNSTLARIIIGTNFAWSDMVAYTSGILFVLLVENKLKLHWT